MAAVGSVQVTKAKTGAVPPSAAGAAAPNRPLDNSDRKAGQVKDKALEGTSKTTAGKVVATLVASTETAAAGSAGVASLSQVLSLQPVQAPTAGPHADPKLSVFHRLSNPPKLTDAEEALVRGIFKRWTLGQSVRFFDVLGLDLYYSLKEVGFLDEYADTFSADYFRVYLNTFKSRQQAMYEVLPANLAHPLKGNTLSLTIGSALPFLPPCYISLIAFRASLLSFVLTVKKAYAKKLEASQDPQQKEIRQKAFETSHLDAKLKLWIKLFNHPASNFDDTHFLMQPLSAFEHSQRDTQSTSSSSIETLLKWTHLMSKGSVKYSEKDAVVIKFGLVIDGKEGSAFVLLEMALEELKTSQIDLKSLQGVKEILFALLKNSNAALDKARKEVSKQLKEFEQGKISGKVVAKYFIQEAFRYLVLQLSADMQRVLDVEILPQLFPSRFVAQDSFVKRLAANAYFVLENFGSTQAPLHVVEPWTTLHAQTKKDEQALVEHILKQIDQPTRDAFRGAVSEMERTGNVDYGTWMRALSAHCLKKLISNLPNVFKLMAGMQQEQLLLVKSHFQLQSHQELEEHGDASIREIQEMFLRSNERLCRLFMMINDIRHLTEHLADPFAGDDSHLIAPEFVDYLNLKGIEELLQQVKAEKAPASASVATAAAAAPVTQGKPAGQESLTPSSASLPALESAALKGEANPLLTAPKAPEKGAVQPATQVSQAPKQKPPKTGSRAKKGKSGHQTQKVTSAGAPAKAAEGTAAQARVKVFSPKDKISDMLNKFKEIGFLPGRRNSHEFRKNPQGGGGIPAPNAHHGNTQLGDKLAGKLNREFEALVAQKQTATAAAPAQSPHKSDS